MTISQHDFDNGPQSGARVRPLWLPHPSLLAFIAVLWALAGAVSALPH